MRYAKLLELNKTQDFPLARKWICDYLEALGTDDRVLRIMRDLPRHAFVPPAYQRLAYTDLDLWLPNAFLPSPSTIARILSFLDLDSTQSVLELITGTGYVTSLLASIAHKVETVDPQFIHLYLSSNASLALGCGNVSQRVGSALNGLPEEGPFDAIILNASLPSIPTELLQQLRSDTGTLIVPVGPALGPQRLLAIKRGNDGPQVIDLGAVAYPALAIIDTTSTTGFVASPAGLGNEPLRFPVSEAQVALPLETPVVKSRTSLESYNGGSAGPEQGDSEDNISIVFGGDVAVTGLVAQALKYGIDPLFGIARLLDADAVAANLETSWAADGDDDAFLADFQPARMLGRYFSALNVANNQAFDSDPKTLPATLEQMEEVGLTAFGGGSDSEAAFRPAILKRKNIAVALLGFDDIGSASDITGDSNIVASMPDPEKLHVLIENCRTTEDHLVVVFMHWGDVYKPDVTIQQRHLGHAIIDAGADLIIGSGSHLVQEIETYKGRLIAYGLGNLLNDDVPEPARAGILLRMLAGKEGFFGWHLSHVFLDRFGLPNPANLAPMS
jgi:protein-L-isoaspartate(D-aspartate) O-methyltransferase